MTKPDPLSSVAALRAALNRGELRTATPARNNREPDLPLMPPGERPQDPELDGSGMRFEGYRIETLEHGGEYPDTMPQAIAVTDAHGCKALYVPLSRDGKVVRSAPLLEALRRTAKAEQGS